MNIINDVSTIQQHDEQLDFKITKRHFPSVNNESILELILKRIQIYFCEKTRLLYVGLLSLSRMLFQIMDTLQNCFPW